MTTPPSSTRAPDAWPPVLSRRQDSSTWLLLACSEPRALDVIDDAGDDPWSWQGPDADSADTGVTSDPAGDTQVAQACEGVTLDADGNASEVPVIELPSGAWRPTIVERDPPLLLASDYEHLLWALPLSAAGQRDGEFVQVVPGVASFDAVDTGAEVLLAICDDAGGLGLVGLDGEGVAVRQEAVGTCGYDAVLSIAAADGRVAGGVALIPW
ncbi:MAG: hypothetical protein ACOZNI_07690 [Myxococcota bacterium]